MYICVYTYIITQICWYIYTCIQINTKQNNIQQQNGLSHIIYCNLDEPGGHNVNWNKSDTEKQIPHDFTHSHMESKEAELAEVESRKEFTRGWGG
jgi:hypothetical protein